VGQVIYLYGVIALADKEKITVLPCHFAPFRDLIAIYSLEDRDEFGTTAFQENIKDMLWVEKKVIRHNELLTAVAIEAAVIPIKFGSVYSGIDVMHNVLSNSYDSFQSQLTKIYNKQEWGLKLNYHSEALIAYLKKHDDVVSKQSELLLSGTAGQRFLAKKKLEVEVKAAKKREINKLREVLHENVKRKSNQIKLLHNTPKELSANGWTNVLNVAILLDREQKLEVDSFFEGGESLVDQLGFKIETTGPWPAYNFVANE
jgi:hypothetical protein